MPKRIYLLAALIWAGVIAFFCLVQLNNAPLAKVSNIDKLVHAFFHLVLTVICFLFLQKNANAASGVKHMIVSLSFSLFFGIGIEIIQELFTATRHAEIFDVLANFCGALLGVTMIQLFDLKSKIK